MSTESRIPRILEQMVGGNGFSVPADWQPGESCQRSSTVYNGRRAQAHLRRQRWARG
jgi:hypothetical protein